MTISIDDVALAVSSSDCFCSRGCFCGCFLLMTSCNSCVFANVATGQPCWQHHEAVSSGLNEQRETQNFTFDGQEDI